MKYKEWILVLALGTLWGSSFFFVEVLLNFLSPFFIVYLRVLFASLILIIVILIKKEQIEFNFTNIFNLSVMALLNNIIPFLLIAIGQQTTTGGLASILNANTSLVAIILASIIIPYEKFTFKRILGVSIGMVGVILALDYQNMFQFFNNNIGKYLILLATVSYAFASIWAKLKLKNLSPLVSATGMLLMSTILLSPYIFTFQMHEIYNLNLTIILYAFVFAFLCSVLAYLLYFKILETTGAGNLLICTIIIPPSAILLDVIIMKQKITISELLGLIVIIVGLLILDGRLISKKKFIR